MIGRTGRPAALAAALACLFLAAPAADATTQSASSLGVTATFTFTGSGLQFHHLRLTISRGSEANYGKPAVVYDEPVQEPDCGTYCAPLSTISSHPSVRVLALNGGSEPQVILGLWTGGANCCEVDQVFSYDSATQTYAGADYNFGDYGERLKDLSHDGRQEFVTGDPIFKYEFTDGAASGEPLKIVGFSKGRFMNITSRYPKLIAADAATWLKYYKRGGFTDSVGVIAAWAADEDSLGHEKRVNAYLEQQAKAGHLVSGLSPQLPDGHKFIVALNRFLRRHGYLH